MAYREKLAWVMSIVLILAGSFYGWEVIGHGLAIGEIPPPSLGLAVVYVFLVVIGSIIGAAGTALLNIGEAEQPADERETIILDKAGHWSGYILGAAVVFGVLHYWYYEDGRLLFHSVVAGLMLSQIAEYVFQIVLYRRGV